MRADLLSKSAVLLRVLCLLWLAGLQPALGAEPALPASTLARIPPALQPWIHWALPTTADWRCPVDYADPHQRRCLWPSALSLRLDSQGGEFSQQARMDAEGWLLLPGDRRYWPQEVHLNAQMIPVVERDGRPALKAAAGDHRITGRFFWSEPPEALRIPPNVALLDLRLEGQPIPLPRLEDDGVLWLRQRPVAAAQQDQLELQVFRLLRDGIPFTVTTRLELSVSGQAREELLGPVLPPDFLPLALDSPLPARLEPDGRLRVQLTPGSWTIHLTARHLGPVDALALPVTPEPWPTQEIWSFQAQNQLRVVQVEGAPALDPTQTNLPEPWRAWPAYLLEPGGELRLLTRQRGETSAAPERLNLERTLWLDFSGSSYTVQDRVSGNLNATRLDAAPELRLGRVAINGDDQFITLRPGAERSGVEVRQMNHLQLLADSRLEPATISDLPAVGWNLTPHSIQTTLNLPPGWRLLAANGPDSVGNAWLHTWNLLDLFLTLLIAFAFGALWGWGWGALALAGMALTLHQPNAPLYVWLNALAASALLRKLPVGRLRNWTVLYRWLALLALLILAVLFALQQVRSALYPQLEHAGVSSGAWLGAAAMRQAEAPLAQSLDTMQSASRLVYAPNAEKPSRGENRKNLQQQKYAPEVKVQTGPGLPDWQWRSARLRWSGPVAMEERLRLWLLPPWGTRLLLLAGLGLLLAMAARLFAPEPRRAPAPPAKPPSKAAPEPSVAALVCVGLWAGLLWIAPQPAQAQSLAQAQAPAAATDQATVSPALPPPTPDWATALMPASFPPPQLLTELRERLTQPPDCPRCADLATLVLTVEGNAVQLRLNLHAQADVAAPLPLPRTGLMVQSIALDGTAALLFRDAKQMLWLRLPLGVHEVVITATVPETVATLQLPLPMTPGRVVLKATGWQVEGYVEGRADQQLQLTRQRDAAATALQAGVMPPFVEIARELTLDVDWQVETRVRRLSQADSAAVVEIPLLPGERITTPGVRVRDGRALLNLPPDQAETSWSAALNRSDTLSLQATDHPGFSEVWRLRAGPLWRVETAGIPLVRRLDEDGQWLPEWRPWPGESVTLSIQRPEGAPGATATVDQSHLQVHPGRRQTETTLALTVRASRGSERVVTLPPGAILTGARLNDVAQPLQQQGQQVTLPLTPGVQNVLLTWREERGISARYATPIVDSGGPSVNARLSLRLPRDRWLLWASGPTLGPAVLFWGLLLVLLAGAALLARFSGAPLRFHAWFLLGVGLSQSHILGVLLVAGWLVLLARRRTLASRASSALRFDLWQVALVLLTLAAFAVLLASIRQGLLGAPDMQVAGYGSSAYLLEWYQDRSAASLPTAWVFSMPLLVYRGLMLAWSLWLAHALLRWLAWAWQCFNADGLWRPLRPRQPLEAPTAP